MLLLLFGEYFIHRVGSLFQYGSDLFPVDGFGDTRSAVAD